MHEEEELLEKSDIFLSDAKSALNSEMSLETVQNRVYYSMFLAAKAALLTEDIETGTHGGVNQQLGKIFVKEKEVLDEDMGRFFSRQQTLREQADYDVETSFDRKEIKENIEKAKRFVEKMREIVEERP